MNKPQHKARKRFGQNFLVDDKVAIVGTINMDYRSLVHHFECAVWM